MVFVAKVVNVTGADERAAHLSRDPHDPLVGAVLRSDAVVLNFEVDILGAKRADELVDVSPGFVLAPVGKPARKARCEAARQCNQALTVAVDLGHVNGRLAALEPFEEAV